MNRPAKLMQFTARQLGGGYRCDAVIAVVVSAFFVSLNSWGHCATNINRLLYSDSKGRGIEVVTSVGVVYPSDPLVFDVVTGLDCEALIAISDFSEVFFTFLGDQVARVIAQNSNLATWKVGTSSLPQVGFDETDPVGTYFIMAGCSQDVEYTSFLRDLETRVATSEMLEQFHYLISIDIIASQDFDLRSGM